MLSIEIDRLVYQLYGFTEEELDFIIRSALPLASSKNYDIKYRMGGGICWRSGILTSWRVRY